MSFDLWRDARVCNPDHLSMSLQVDRRHGAGLAIRMRPAIPARLGWKAGAKLTVHRGTGDDAGKLRLKRGGKFSRTLYSDRPEKYAAGMAPLILKLKAWPELGTVSQRSQKCEWRIPADDPEALEIDMPGWAR